MTAGERLEPRTGGTETSCRQRSARACRLCSLLFVSFHSRRASLAFGLGTEGSVSPQGILQRASLLSQGCDRVVFIAGNISQLGGSHQVEPCHGTQDHVTKRRSVPRGLPLTPNLTSGAPGEPAGLEWAAQVLLGIPSQHSCTERRGCGCCLWCLPSHTRFDTMCFDLCAPESASPSPPACWDHV